MNKQDSNGVRNAQDIERKYDFSQMLGLKKNIETSNNELIKIQNELNDFMSSTIGNIDDLQKQIDGKVTTWYYKGTPTLENQPSILWDKDDIRLEHIDDLYYDKDTGYCYIFQFENDLYKWEKINDKDVIESLAIANSAKDTADNKRHVFINQPFPPYDAGDLWINENEIFICQISRKTGEYEKNDWTNDLKYTDNTMAEQVDGKLTVLNGTVQEITENYVKYTDLSTGGSTTIAGDNIKTGSIISNNYAKNVSGTRIRLTDGNIDTKNFKVDSQGNVKLGEGAKVIGGDGLLTNLQIIGTVKGGYMTPLNGEFQFLGFTGLDGGNEKTHVVFNAYIPENFKIENAQITLIHSPTQYYDYNGNLVCYGYSRALKIYKCISEDNSLTAVLMSEYTTFDNSVYEEIVDGFGQDSLTASIPSINNLKTETFFSKNISDSLVAGRNNRIKIETSMGVPEYNIDQHINSRNIGQYTGCAMAILNITGYNPYDYVEEE